MDPIFGLPCIVESKAMDAARSRNQSQEKKLADKFGAIAMDMKSRSSKLITNKSDTEELMTRIDLSTQKCYSLPNGLSQEEKQQYKQLIRKADSLSMTLSELDRRLADRKSKANRNLIKILAGKMDTEVTSSSDDCDEEGTQKHLVYLGDKKCILPINRKKHAMRDAWNRAISEDVKYKHETHKSSLIPSSSPTRKSSTVRNNNIISGVFNPMLQNHKLQSAAQGLKTQGNRLSHSNISGSPKNIKNS